MVFRRAGRKGLSFQGQTRTGWEQLTVSTDDRPLAKRVEAMWVELASAHRAWDVLEPVLHMGRGRAKALLRLYDLWTLAERDLVELRRRLNDARIDLLVDAWETAYRGEVNHDTANHAIAHVRFLIPPGKSLLASEVTPAWLAKRLHEYEVAPRSEDPTKSKARKPKRNTLRKVHSNWSIFFEYATTVAGAFPESPMAKVKRPKKEDAPIKFHDMPDVLRIVAGGPREDARVLFALAYGSAIELSVILGREETPTEEALPPLRAKDFTFVVTPRKPSEPPGPPRERLEVRAPGTKVHTRDRVSIVAPWAVPTLRKYLKTLLPEAPLFPALTRWTASDYHRETQLALNLPAYPLHNARHHWAVMRLRAGAPLGGVQRQLGHSTPVVTLTTYGAFIQTGDDAEMWEDRVAQDLERRARGHAEG